MYEDVGKMHRTKILVKKFVKMGRPHLGDHYLVRRMNSQGEVLIWCRKCSGYARQRMGTLTDDFFARPEPMGTQGYGKMLKRIQVLEDGGVPAKEARNWRKETKEKNHKKRESEASEQV